MATKPLLFYFNTKDKSYKVATEVYDKEPNLITQTFVNAPIYQWNTNNLIGYVLSDDYTQQIDDNSYILRINQTFYFQKKDSISWYFTCKKQHPNNLFPPNTLSTSTIISGTGLYYGKEGTVTVQPMGNHIYQVSITFLQ